MIFSSSSHGNYEALPPSIVYEEGEYHVEIGMQANVCASTRERDNVKTENVQYSRKIDVMNCLLTLVLMRCENVYTNNSLSID